MHRFSTNAEELAFDDLLLLSFTQFSLFDMIRNEIYRKSYPYFLQFNSG